MRSLEEEYLLIRSLSRSEKRYVKLQGKVLAGGKGSEHLRLFDLLNQQNDYDHTALSADLTARGLAQSVPTIAGRLHQLVSSSLLIQHRKKSLAARLSADLYASRLYLRRGRLPAAARCIDKALKMALDFGCYAEALAFFDLQRELLLARGSAQLSAELERLRADIMPVRAFLEVQQELRHLQGLLQAQIRTEIRPRKASEAARIRVILAELPDLDARKGPDLMSLSLAMDLKGLSLLISREGQEALRVYTHLLARWREAPAWIQEYPDVYLRLFKNYQYAIYYGSLNSAELNGYLEFLPDIQSLPLQSRLDFQRITFSHQLTLGLNMGQFEAVLALEPRVLAWLDQHPRDLGANVHLAFLHNMVVARFLYGDFSGAYTLLKRIINRKKGPEREDIRDFARILQVILLYELEDHDLNSYLTRSNRRYFKQSDRLWDFENGVNQFVQAALQKGQLSDLDTEMQILADRLESLIQETASPFPLVGLVEVQLWLHSKQRGIPLPTVFLEKIREVMGQLDAE